METVLFAVVAAFSSCWFCWLTIVTARSYGLGIDHLVGVQKFHKHRVPRLGGLPIFAALSSSLLLMAWHTGSQIYETVALIVCTLPAFGIGLVEDMTRRAGIFVRFVFTMGSAVLGMWLLGASLDRVDVPVLDALLQHSASARLLLTLIGAAGIANALNIVDGFNGLSSFYAAAAFCALAVVAGFVDDPLVLRASALCAAAILGFLVWNFPFGKIFLGDAGAYLCGFLIGELSILLVVRHPEVSAWFPLLLLIYPVWETLFSMYRRALDNLSSVAHPDALHMHHLVFLRLNNGIRPAAGDRPLVLQNSITSIYFWILALICAGLGIVFWRNTPVLVALTCLFICGYGATYQRLKRFGGARTAALPAAAPADIEDGIATDISLGPK